MGLLIILHGDKCRRFAGLHAGLAIGLHTAEHRAVGRAVISHAYTQKAGLTVDNEGIPLRRAGCLLGLLRNPSKIRAVQARIDVKARRTLLRRVDYHLRQVVAARKIDLRISRVEHGGPEGIWIAVCDVGSCVPVFIRMDALVKRQIIARGSDGHRDSPIVWILYL